MLSLRILSATKMQNFSPRLFFLLTLILSEISISLGAPSVLPCKSSERLNPEDGRCYPEGPGGPCPETLSFVSDDDRTSKYSEQQGEYIAVGKCECSMKTSQHPCRHLPVLYSDTFNRCYEIYSQGPCTAGDWYTPVKYVQDNITDYKGVCTQNPCMSTFSDTLPLGGALSNTSGSKRWYLHKGKCYQTGTQGHCMDHVHVAYFLENDPAPYCGDFHSVYGECGKAAAVERCEYDQMFHEVTGKCYKEGSKGPCPDTMALNYPDSDRVKSYQWQFGDYLQFGQCDCQLDESANPCARRPYLFYVPAQQCFPAFTQGPCGSSEWFRPILMKENKTQEAGTKSRFREGICTKNDCLGLVSAVTGSFDLAAQNDSSNNFYFGIGDSQCYLTGSNRGFCKKSEVAAFISDNHIPFCTTVENISYGCPHGRGSIGASGGLSCPKGQFVKNGLCVYKAEF